MVAAPPESTYAVLGLIDKVPASSGHELAAVAEKSFAHFWPISRTLLYRELNRLVALGWVSAARVEQTRVPSKWIYELTPPGRAALESWLAGPVSMTGSFRSGVLLRFFFAHRSDPAQVQALLEDYRNALLVQLDEFSVLVDKLGSVPGYASRIGRLSALHGLRTAQARLAWIDEAGEILTEEGER